jgi:hypothetical protein
MKKACYVCLDCHPNPPETQAVMSNRKTTLIHHTELIKMSLSLFCTKTVKDTELVIFLSSIMPIYKGYFSIKISTLEYPPTMLKLHEFISSWKFIYNKLETTTIYCQQNYKICYFTSNTEKKKYSAIGKSEACLKKNYYTNFLWHKNSSFKVEPIR